MNLEERKFTSKQIKFLDKALSEFYRNNFYAFVKDWFGEWKGVPFKPHYSTEYLCEHIQLAINGDTERLVVSLPRGWGKTDIISVAGPSYALMLNPKERIGCFSRALTEDAKMWHQGSAEILSAPKSLKYFPNEDCRLASYSKMILRTNAGGYRKIGSCLSSSVGSDMTLAIIDDPADQEHFRSEAKRTRLEYFFTKSLFRAVRAVDYDETEEYLSQLTAQDKRERKLTKLLEAEATKNNIKNKKPRIILTMQRLHINDPVSMFLKINEKMEKAGIKTSFKYINIPAIHEERKIYSFPISKQEHIAEAGQYTLAGTLNREKIEEARIDMLKEDFEAQMQQNPTIGRNVVMQECYFTFYSQEELLSAKIMKIFITCDTASKTGTANDYSVMCCWGWNGQNLYLLDMIRGKWEFGLLADNFKAFQVKWQNGLKQGVKLSKIIIEDKSSGTQLHQWASTFLSKHLLEAKQRNSGNDKFSRYAMVGNFIEKQRVKIPAFNVEIDGVQDVRGTITNPFLSEVSSFSKDNSHKHDDICDCLFDACYEVHARIMDTLTLPKILF